MKTTAISDLAFCFHSSNEKQIVGIFKVCALYHSCLTNASGRFGMVTVKAEESPHIPLTLADIRADEQLQDIALVRQSRFSVTPVTASHFDIIKEKALSQLYRMTGMRMAASQLPHHSSSCR